MAKKKSSNLSKTLICTLLVSVGIYLVVIGVVSTMTEGWRAFSIALGLGLQTSGTIGFAQLK